MAGASLGEAVACGGNRAAVPVFSATVRVTAISPTPGARVGEASVIRAAVEYSISHFARGQDRYYLSLQFAMPDGGTFNHYRRFADELELTAPTSSVRIEYPLARVWANAKLKRPITVWFSVLELQDHMLGA